MYTGWYVFYHSLMESLVQSSLLSDALIAELLSCVHRSQILVKSPSVGVKTDPEHSRTMFWELNQHVDRERSQNQYGTPLNTKSHWHPLAIDASLIHLNNFPNTLASWDLLTWHSAQIGIVLGTQRGLNGMRKAGRHRWTSRHVDDHPFQRVPARHDYIMKMIHWSMPKWFTMPVIGVMTCNDNVLHCGSKHLMILV